MKRSGQLKFSFGAKVTVVGSRNARDYKVVKDKLDEFQIKTKLKIVSIVTCGYAGTETIARKWAKDNKVQHTMITGETPKERSQRRVLQTDALIAFPNGDDREMNFAIRFAMHRKKTVIIHSTTKK